MAYVHPDSLVSTEWLAAHLDDPAVRVVDGSFKMPGVAPTAREDYAKRHIVGAPFFDIDEIADRSSSLPHMLPKPEEFAAHVSRLGIGDGQRVVAYDATGWSMAACRVWWMLRVFGHDDVVVLAGGLAKWSAEGRPVTAEVPRLASTNFTPRFHPELVRDKEAVRRTIGGHREQIIDARAQGRFEGTMPELRPGLRSGHIPGSRNLPYDQLVDPATKIPLPADALEQRFRAAGLRPDRPIIASCGSGVSACALAFGLHLIGWPEASVYDGSWTEWGAPGDTPVEPGPAS
ncbi:MAG TPA: 3-mercaptopyruvate sulfurtransferase [Stellaceae bacterium]|nr:3-mercaptopyruvate sulfurtransferase [Stellaceae bacterium]